ncbi:MAG: hypothetical protein H6945_04190 [Zoogloeaceae bacterium]|nr:hypothetical protein [Rhodocyclaceae bacterium]MCP5234921.1 hypothetical protein [Zoogloeaceae bacterium]
MTVPAKRSARSIGSDQSGADEVLHLVAHRREDVSEVEERNCGGNRGGDQGDENRIFGCSRTFFFANQTRYQSLERSLLKSPQVNQS